MRTYELGKKYEFIVKYFYKDGEDESQEKSWFSLSDGESFTKYNVPAYPYQEEGWEGKKIVCTVTKVCDNGYPYLLQEKDEILSHYYKVGETYWFSVIEQKIDTNLSSYYILLDRLQGISHRFYTDTNLQGLVGFKVKSIKKDNKGSHLELELAPSANQKETPEKQKAEAVENRCNPFGHEDGNHEWKSSLVFPSSGSDPENPDVKKQVLNIMRSIAGFQNADGGLLYLGVTGTGNVSGIEKDYPHLNGDGDTNVYPADPDGYELKIRNAVSYYLGKTSLDHIEFKFFKKQSSQKIFCIIIVNKTPRVIYRSGSDVFKRFGNGYKQLFGDEISDLVQDKISDKSAQAVFTYPMPDDCSEYNPNVSNAAGTTIQPSYTVVKLSKGFIKKVDYYYMTFYSDNTFMYSHDSHASDSGVICEVQFNKINGNLEYSRDLLIKCSSDGHALFLPAYDVCKLGKADERIKMSKSDIFTVKVAHKYDFLKVFFSNGTENREKYVRVVSLFGQDTENNLKENKDLSDIKYQLGLKGNSMIPSGYKLTGVNVIHETLPDEILFVSARGGLGSGIITGTTDIDVSTY